MCLSVTVVLVGFSYQNDPDRLPGTLIDLCRASIYFKQFPQLVFTDLSVTVKDLLDARQEDLIDERAIELIQEIQVSEKTYYPNDLLSKFPTGKIIFYFTGHAVWSMMKFPTGHYLPFDQLPVSDEHVFILDCCDTNSNGRSNWLVSDQQKIISTNAGSDYTRKVFSQLENNSQTFSLPEWFFGYSIRVLTVDSEFLSLKKIL